MGEAKPADPVPSGTGRSDPGPVLVAVGGDETRPREPERSGVSRTLFGALVVLLVLTAAGLALQTRHARGQAQQIGGLTQRVEGLEAQLAAANGQVASYDMQLSMVRAAVAGVFEQMQGLQAILGDDPAAAAAAAPADPAAGPGPAEPDPDPALPALSGLPADLDLPLVAP